MTRLNRTATVIDGLIKCGILEGNKDRNELRPTANFLCLLYEQKGTGPVGFLEYKEEEDTLRNIDDPETKQNQEYLRSSSEIRSLIAHWVNPLYDEDDMDQDMTFAEVNFLEDEVEVVYELIRGIVNKQHFVLAEKSDDMLVKENEEIMGKEWDDESED
jgi:hypothetical protein